MKIYYVSIQNCRQHDMFIVFIQNAERQCNKPFDLSNTCSCLDTIIMLSFGESRRACIKAQHTKAIIHWLYKRRANLLIEHKEVIVQTNLLCNYITYLAFVSNDNFIMDSTIVVILILSVNIVILTLYKCYKSISS